MQATTSSRAVPGDPVVDGLSDRATVDRLLNIIRAAQKGRGTAWSASAEEILSEVCDRVLAKSSDFDPSRGTLLGWLGGFVFRILCERRPKQPIVASMEDRQDDSPQGVAAIDAKIDADALLAKLPPEDARLLRWKFEGRTCREMAMELGATPEAIRVRIYRIEKSARERFGASRHEEGRQ